MLATAGNWPFTIFCHSEKIEKQHTNRSLQTRRTDMKTKYKKGLAAPAIVYSWVGRRVESNVSSKTEGCNNYTFYNNNFIRRRGSFLLKTKNKLGTTRSWAHQKLSFYSLLSAHLLKPQISGLQLTQSPTYIQFIKWSLMLAITMPSNRCILRP